MVKRLALAALACGLVSISSAGLTDAALKIGFYKGFNFKGKSGQDMWLEGLNIGIDIPVYRLPTGTPINFTPSILLGGINRSGADTDGFLYRGMLTTRFSAPKDGFYFTAGLGWGGAATRGGAQFDPQQGAIVQAGVGYHLGGSFSPLSSVEVNSFLGDPQLSGLELTFVLKF